MVSIDQLPPEPLEPRRTIPRPLAIFVAVGALAVLLLWLAGTPPGVEGKLGAIGYAICHRIPARSFLINGMPMPLCARCTGIYLGVMICFLIAIAAGRTRVSQLPKLGVIAVLVLFVLIMGVDGINSYFRLFPSTSTLYEPHNWLRLTTGMFCGVAMFHLVFPIFNSVVWRDPSEGRSLNSFAELVGVCLVCAVVILLVLTERPLFLWILGTLSALGVALLLVMIGSVLFLTLLRLDRFATQWRHLTVPLLAGLLVALVELGLIDLLRYALTGTWNGFPLGG